LVVIDNFTRYVELYPIPKQDAPTCARAFLQFVGRYGLPYQIVSDNGPTFVNELIEELVRLMGNEHVKVYPYSHEENSIVERSNKEIIRHLRGILFDKNVVSMWSDLLPLVQRIMNATVHSSIGTSPARLVFGNAVNLDRGVLLPPQLVKNQESLSEWSKRMLDKQAEILAIAQRIQQETNTKHIQKRVGGTHNFEIGDFVLVEYYANAGGPLGRPSKLSYNLRGPLRVVDIKESGNILQLQDMVTMRLLAVSVKYIRPFFYDESIVDPREVAYKDERLFVINEIIKHRGDTKTKTKMEFYVHWDGCDDKRDYTWESYKNVKTNEKFVEYCRKKGLEQLLPPSMILYDEAESDSEVESSNEGSDDDV